MKNNKTQVSKSVKETHHHAAKFSKSLKKKFCHLILLEGPLGVGKTEWARGFIKALTKSKLVITSPTYSIVNRYGESRRKIFHVDLFRLKGIDDLESVGFWECLSENNVVVVEWGEMLPPQWPKDVQVSRVKFGFGSRETRTLEIIYPTEFQALKSQALKRQVLER